MSRRRHNSSPFSLFSFQDIITATTGILILLALILALSVVMQSEVSEQTDSFEDTTELVTQLEQLEIDVERLKKSANQISTSMEMVVGFTPQELRYKKNSLESSIKILASNVASQRLQNAESELKLRTQKEKSDFRANSRELADLKQKVAETLVEMENLKKDNRVFFNFRQSTTVPWLVEISGTSIRVARAGVKQAAKQFTTAREVIEFSESVPAGERYFVLLVKPTGIEKYDLIRGHLASVTADIGVELLGENENAIDNKSGAAN